MKITVEMEDSLHREAKVAAARLGITLSQSVEEALSERLARGYFTVGKGRGWPLPPPDVPREEIRRIQRLIDADRKQIDDPSCPNSNGGILSNSRG